MKLLLGEIYLYKNIYIGKFSYIAVTPAKFRVLIPVSTTNKIRIGKKEEGTIKRINDTEISSFNLA